MSIIAIPSNLWYVLLGNSGTSQWAITPAERQRQHDYARLFPGEAGDLNQNPVSGRELKSRWGRFHTFTHSMGFMFSAHHMRLICPTPELALSMGFPATADTSAASGTDCIFTRGYPYAPDTRSHRSVRMQLGNSIHVPNIGGIHLILCLKLPTLGACHAPEVRKTTIKQSRPPSAFKVRTTHT